MAEREHSNHRSDLGQLHNRRDHNCRQRFAVQRNSEQCGRKCHQQCGYSYRDCNLGSPLDYAATLKRDGNRQPDGNFLGDRNRDGSFELSVAEGHDHDPRRHVSQLHHARDHIRGQWHAI